MTLGNPDSAFPFFTAPEVAAATQLCFKLTVSNGTPPSDDTDEVRVTILPYPAPPTNAPVLDPIGNQSVNEGQLLTFTVSGSDPNGDPLTYSASGLPSGASFDLSTRTFSWTGPPRPEASLKRCGTAPKATSGRVRRKTG